MIVTDMPRFAQADCFVGMGQSCAGQPKTSLADTHCPALFSFVIFWDVPQFSSRINVYSQSDSARRIPVITGVGGNRTELKRNDPAQSVDRGRRVLTRKGGMNIGWRATALGHDAPPYDDSSISH
jgi:hypothetical protein